MHHSQKIISRDDGTVTFSIFACPDTSLVMELLRLGPGIEVTGPESLREQIVLQLRKTLEKYGDIPADRNQIGNR